MADDADGPSEPDLVELILADPAKILILLLDLLIFNSHSAAQLFD